MADEIKNPTQVNEPKTDIPKAEPKSDDKPTNDTPTATELMAQLAAERAEKEKTKAALDKALKEKGEVTKALRAKQTTEEQEQEAREEAQRLAEEERDAMRKELNHIKAVAAYKDLSSDKAVENLIGAVSEADHSAIAAIIQNEVKAAVRAAEATWMKSRPSVGGNAYSSMTKEQIMALPDRHEKLRAIAMNQELFK